MNYKVIRNTISNRDGAEIIYFVIDKNDDALRVKRENYVLDLKELLTLIHKPITFTNDKYIKRMLENDDIVYQYDNDIIFELDDIEEIYKIKESHPEHFI